MSIVEVFANHQLAVAVGIGVAASIAGVILIEAVALTRLLHVLTAPLTLIDPERIYEGLLKPSLIALWLGQLIVFAGYPRFATRNGLSRFIALPIAAAAVLFTGWM